MQLNAELLDRLSQLGGTALFVAMVVVAGVGLKRRWWAPWSVVDRQDELIRDLRTENAAWREMYLELLTGQSRDRAPFSKPGPRDELPK